MGDLTFRPAQAGDVAALNWLLNDPPNPAAIKIAGSRNRAIRAGRLLVDAGLSLQIAHTTMAVLDGEPAGLMDASSGRGEPQVTPATVAKLLLPMLRIAGPIAIYRLFRSRPAYARVAFPGDAASFYIAELDVASALRNRGIGGALLDLAEERARAEGCPRLTLATDITNPAQHLYARHGFRITDTRRDAAYERWSGSPGRVWMVKDLAKAG